jgi:hypothetical protein
MRGRKKNVLVGAEREGNRVIGKEVLAGSDTNCS